MLPPRAPAVDGVRDAAAHPPVVPGAVDDVGIGDAVDELIKELGKEGADGRLTLAGGAAGGRAVVALLGDGPVELRQQSRRVLEVGVHQRHEVALGVLEPGKHPGLLAKVSREGEKPHTVIPGCQLP